MGSHDYVNNHAFCEFQIPISYLGKENTYGFYAFEVDSSTGRIVQFPESSVGTHTEMAAWNYVPSSPNNWGDVKLEVLSNPSPSVPETSSTIMLLALTFALVIVYFGKTRGYNLRLENKL